MQAPLDPSFLTKLLLIFFLVAFMWLFIYLTRGREIRRGGVYNAFNNDDEGEQNASKMDILTSGIDTAFNNNKKGKQNVDGTIITSINEPSQAAILLHNLLQFIASLFRGGKHPATSKGKQF